MNFLQLNTSPKFELDPSTPASTPALRMRRLAEWRDKEIANRIRILKITLWASVIVGAFSLIYSYVKVYLVH